MLLAIDQIDDTKACFNLETLPDKPLGASGGTVGLPSILQLRAYVCSM